MDVAGVIVGSIALLLALLSLAVPGYQLQRYFRFRKPLFKIEKAWLEVSRLPPPNEREVFVGPGKIVLNARGATRPIFLREYEVFSFRPDGERGRVGGGSGQALRVELPPEQWTRLELDLIVGFGLGELDEIPRKREVEVYLKSPEEPFRVLVPLELTRRKNQYVLDDYKELRRNALRTYSRNESRVLRWIRRLLEKVRWPKGSAAR